MAADLWDLEHAKAGPKKKAKYPRPYDDKTESKRRGDTAGRTVEEVKALLRNGQYFGQPQAPV